MTTNTPALAQGERSRLSYAAVSMESVGAGGALAPKNLGDVVAFAQVMARADIALPKHLRGNDGACMAVSMQAMRWEMDPFAVANKSYSVNDRLAYEAQLIAAVVHTRAPIQGRPNYVYTGQGNSRRCQVTCKMIDGEEREYTSPEFGQITTKNSPLWKSDPDQQLGYFAIRSWARRHTPEVILGVYTPEEAATFSEPRDVTPQGTGLRARLEASRSQPQAGFTSSHGADGQPVEEIDVILEGDGLPTHDAETGEVIEAGETAPDDAHAPSPPPAQPNLNQRVADFKRRLAEATSTVKVKSIWAAADVLRADLDAKDPERLPEIEEAFNERFTELEDAEIAAREQG